MTRTFTANFTGNVATIARTLANTFNLKSSRNSNTMTSNIARCSWQDFYTKMARLDSLILASCALFDRRPTNTAQAAYSHALHEAMGYRADQPEY